MGPPVREAMPERRESSVPTSLLTSVLTEKSPVEVSIAVWVTCHSLQNHYWCRLLLEEGTCALEETHCWKKNGTFGYVVLSSGWF